jgi:hypothetical protein
MAYSVKISRQNPTCFLFLLDQSGSMTDPFGGSSGKRKCDGLADAINRLLYELVLKSTASEGVRDWFHVGVIGYGATGVRSAFGGELAGRDLVPISEIADKPLRIEERTRKSDDGAGGIFEQSTKFPVWFEPKAENGTPMCDALLRARDLVQGFIGRSPSCFPPIVINITDGEATDGDPELPAATIRQLATTDGNVLLFNAHLSSESARTIEYPASEAGLGDQSASRLFRMSSPLPPSFRAAAGRDGPGRDEAPRGVVYNADLVGIVQFLQTGTTFVPGLG